MVKSHKSTTTYTTGKSRTASVAAEKFKVGNFGIFFIVFCPHLIDFENDACVIKIGLIRARFAFFWIYIA